VGEAVADLEAAPPDRTKRAPRPRKGFAAYLERVEQVIEPDAPEDCAGLDRVLIGEDVSERLDVTPAKFRVIVTRRPKYVYRNRDGVFQAPAPVHIIASGIPTERLLAQIAVSRYADGLPLYRQESIYARDGVELSRALMAQWMGKVGFELQPLADYVLERIRQAERVFADEPSLPTLAPGGGKVRKAWLWAYARDDRPYGGTAPPMVAYRFEDSRGSECVARHMAGFAGILQVDGYSAYTKLAKANTGANDAMALAGCWAHLRRRFYELHISGVSRLASETVTTMAELWKVEDEIRGHAPHGSAPGSVCSHRCRLVQAMGKGIASHLGKVETGRGNPVCHITAGGARALPHRRTGRNRLQHCRARYQAADNNQKK
jgi:transposase